MVRKIHTDSRKTLLPETLTAYLQCKLNFDSVCHDFEVTPEMSRLAKSCLCQQVGASGRLELSWASRGRDAVVKCVEFVTNVRRFLCEINCKDFVQNLMVFLHNAYRCDALRVGKYAIG